MKKPILLVILLFMFGIIFTKFASAVYEPTSVENNRFGIHILFPDEIKDAARLVNSSGGDWGYITIPIQAYDKDIEKWQKFMDDCKDFHLIPIVRLATNGDYFNAKVWEKPKPESILDFANFLNSLNWPTKNRYIVVFNEVNRGDEWGGIPNPKEYAEILSYSVSVFKSKSNDFFIISSGMDNASENVSGQSINQFRFFQLMDNAVAGIFSQIDGIASHSYPNPGFSQPPTVLTSKSILSFNYEKALINRLSNKDLPVFITETGWTQNRFSDLQIGKFYETAFSNTWNNEKIIAVTPFLLKAGTEPFLQFSLIDQGGQDSEKFKLIEKIKKTKGNPQINKAKDVLGKEIEKELPQKKFQELVKEEPSFNKKTAVISALKWLLKVE